MRDIIKTVVSPATCFCQQMHLSVVASQVVVQLTIIPMLVLLLVVVSK